MLILLKRKNVETQKQILDNFLIIELVVVEQTKRSIYSASNPRKNLVMPEGH